jgi:hypothetical protein
MKTLKIVFLSSVIITQVACVSNGPITTDETGTVVGSTLVGAAIGALGGAALNSYGRGGYGRYGRGYQPNYAVNGAFAGAATGALVGINTVNQNRQQAIMIQQREAEIRAAQYGSTNCSSQRIIDSNGRVYTTENCQARVERPGYQAW